MNEELRDKKIAALFDLIGPRHRKLLNIVGREGTATNRDLLKRTDIPMCAISAMAKAIRRAAEKVGFPEVEAAGILRIKSTDTITSDEKSVALTVYESNLRLPGVDENNETAPTDPIDHSDGVSSAMTRLYVAWRKSNNDRRREILQVVQAFLYTAEREVMK